jgi:hypothetical protein
MATSNLSPSETEAQVFRALGHAVARHWSKLPHDIQCALFEEAVASHGEAVRQQLAVFLHHRHSRTLDAFRARATLEPDCLGG